MRGVRLKSAALAGSWCVTWTVPNNRRLHLSRARHLAFGVPAHGATTSIVAPPSVETQPFAGLTQEHAESRYKCARHLTSILKMSSEGLQPSHVANSDLLHCSRTLRSVQQITLTGAACYACLVSRVGCYTRLASAPRRVQWERPQRHDFASHTARMPAARRCPRFKLSTRNAKISSLRTPACCHAMSHPLQTFSWSFPGVST